jgi:WD40 repeat protein
VWDAGTGKELLKLNGYGPVAISSDGRVIFSPRSDGIKVWDAATGQEKRTLKGDTGSVYCVALSGDGQLIVSGEWGYDWKTSKDWAELKVWDAATGQQLRTLKWQSRKISTMALSSDGRRIVSVSWDGMVKVWDAATGQELHTYMIHSHTRDTTGPSVAVSGDGRRIVSVSGDGTTVEVWDAGTGKVLRTLKWHTRSVTSVAISSDGRWIVWGAKYLGGEHYEVKVWDAATGQEHLTVNAHSLSGWRGWDFETAVAISSDGRWIVSAGQADGIRLWDAATGEK